MKHVSILLLTFSLCLTTSMATGPDTAQADALYRAAKWKEAREAYEKVVPDLKGNDLARVLNAIGYTWQNHGKYAEAIGCYEKVVAMEDIEPHHRANAHLKAGVCLQLQRKFEEAIASFDKARAVVGAPPDLVAEALIFTGTCYVQLDQKDKGVASWRSIAEVDGVRGHYVAAGLLNIGQLHHREGRYQEALDTFNRVLEQPGAGGKQKDHARSRIGECTALLQGGDPFYIKPYVTRVSGDTVKLYWVSLGETLDDEVVLSDGDQSIKVPVTKQPISRTMCSHHIAIPKDLKPGAVYRYTVRSGGKTIEGSIRTAPPPGVPVTFCEIGDTQPMGNKHKDVAKILGAENPDFVIHVGDMTDLGSEWGRWKAEFFDQGWPYLQKAAIWPAVGNHDGGHYFPTLFDQDYRRMYYSFDYGDVHLVALDSYWSGTGGKGRAAQLKWFEEDMAKTDRTWRIVYFHVPMITVDYTWEAFGVNDFLPLFTKYGVDLVIAGHEHLYHRYLPIAKDGSKPFIAITAGGGGGPTGGSIPSPIGVKRYDHNHFLVFKAHGDTLEMWAKTLDGALLDEMKLVKKDGRFQPEIEKAAVEVELATQIKHIYVDLLKPNTFDLTADFETKPEPGKAVKLSVDMKRLPRGGFKQSMIPRDATLVIQAVEGSRWNVSPQEMDLSQSMLTFGATVPGDFRMGAGTFTPALEVQLNVKSGGRTFQPVSSRVITSAEGFQRLQATSGGAGLPALWDFRADPEDVGAREKWYAEGASTKDWRKLSVIAAWENQLNDEYDGIGWYRATAEAPTVREGHRLWLEFGAIDESCWVYVNGREAGRQIYDTHIDDNAWEKPRRFDITSLVRPGTTNLFVVKVQDLHGQGGIYRGAILREEPVNLLPSGSFQEGSRGWRVWRKTGDTVKELKDNAADTAIKLAPDLGKYVDEKSLRIETDAKGSTHLTTRIEPGLAEGGYQFTVRARQRLFQGPSRDNGPVTATIAVSRVQDDPTAADHRDVLAQLQTASTSGTDWVQITRAFHVGKQQAGKPLAVILSLGAHGIYQIDEVSVQLVEDTAVARK